MCGIVGFSGDFHLSDILEGLHGLEYRGYDSAGVAAVTEGRLRVARSVGRVKELEEKLCLTDFSGARVAVGHTRWATHGSPTEQNAHPQLSADRSFAAVHNGIIENAETLKRRLKGEGVSFVSETDTEVIPQLFAKCFSGDLALAASKTLSFLNGAYALCLITPLRPDTLLAAASESPAFVGVGKRGSFVASDLSVLHSSVEEFYRLERGEFALLCGSRVSFFSRDGHPIEKEARPFAKNEVGVSLGEYPHFMLKEIFEQPRAVSDTLSAFVSQGRVCFGEQEAALSALARSERIYIVGCGSAYHAGLVGKRVFEQLARIPTEVVTAGEFRYGDHPIDQSTLLIAVSQSGETADTVAAAKEAKRRGAALLSVVNVEDSLLTGLSELSLLTRAGKEVSVATTKAYSAQLAVFYLLGIFFASKRNHLTERQERELVVELMRLPHLIERTLSLCPKMEEAAGLAAEKNSVFFIGRGMDCETAREASLKLKELSYLHSEACSAAELKHGTISLIEEGSLVFALCSSPFLADKTQSNLSEVSARGGRVILLSGEELPMEAFLRLPKVHPLFAPSLYVLPFQLLAYHTALIRGCDVDKPRNLAKSVTVE